MNQQISTNIYTRSKDIFIYNMMPGHELLHKVNISGWVLDLALGGAVEINGISLSGGLWRLGYVNAKDRVIRGTGEVRSEFLSLSLHRNPYDELTSSGIERYGNISIAMAYPILKITSMMENQTQKLDIEIWINGYIQHLIIQLNNSGLHKSSFRYEELKAIYKTISGLNRVVGFFPTAAELVKQTGMSEARFQKGCQVLYGQSAQKIIQHLKMNQAFNSILNDRMTIGEASLALGYQHSPNFITAFHSHFSVTPIEALQLIK